MSWFGKKQQNAISSNVPVSKVAALASQQRSAALAQNQSAWANAYGQQNQAQNSYANSTTNSLTWTSTSATLGTTGTLYGCEDHVMSRYVFSEEGMKKLVEGKLQVQKVTDDAVDGDFIVSYDGLRISVNPFTFQFLWKGQVICTLDVEKIHLTRGDTLTLEKLEGKIPFRMSS